MKRAVKQVYFPAALRRLKKALGVSKAREVAALLEMSETAFAQRKQRNAFPEREVIALAIRRPELALDTHYIFTGVLVDNLVSSQAAFYSAVREQLNPLRARNKPHYKLHVDGRLSRRVSKNFKQVAA